MGKHDARWYFEQAKQTKAKDGGIEFDEPAGGNYDEVVSLGDDPGAYVQAWVWVEDEEDEPWIELRAAGASPTN
ncbi:MAG TPA: hypothetical protein VGK54_06325 [Chloroflexota bacterium]|jgi:hypothetical protein